MFGYMKCFYEKKIVLSAHTHQANPLKGRGHTVYNLAMKLINKTLGVRVI